MYIPNYESKVCDAVVRVVEKRTGESRADVRFPEEDRWGPLVDLRLIIGTQEYAIEHTRIEPFEKQIKTSLELSEIRVYIERNLLESLPEPAYYELQVPIGFCLPVKKKERALALKNLVDWIRESAECLYVRNLHRTGPIRRPHWSDDHVKGRPEGFNCEIELLRWSDAVLIRRKPGYLGFRLFCPREFSDLEDRRYDRLTRAFSRKLPKLQKCKAAGARTVLVLETRDRNHTRFDQIGNGLPRLLAEHPDTPDEIYLVVTETDQWWVYPIKLGDDHWPKVGMPKWGQPIYEPDKLPTLGVPKRIRDALQLDEVYAPHPADWCPAIFNKDELNDLKSDEKKRQGNMDAQDRGKQPKNQYNQADWAKHDSGRGG